METVCALWKVHIYMYVHCARNIRENDAVVANTCVYTDSKKFHLTSNTYVSCKQFTKTSGRNILLLNYVSCVLLVM